jgi:hypothetical protein
VRNLLCTPIPLPNGLVIPELPPAQEGMTTRERFEMHSSDPACAGCHSVFDPAGFALESFDEVGRFRAMDHGKPVDNSGTMALQIDMASIVNTDAFRMRLAEGVD